MGVLGKYQIFPANITFITNQVFFFHVDFTASDSIRAYVSSGSEALRNNHLLYQFVQKVVTVGIMFPILKAMNLMYLVHVQIHKYNNSLVIWKQMDIHLCLMYSRVPSRQKSLLSITTITTKTRKRRRRRRRRNHTLNHALIFFNHTLKIFNLLVQTMPSNCNNPP